MKRKKYIIITIVVIIMIIIGFNINSNNDIQSINQDTSGKSNEKKVYLHTFPEQIEKNDFFRGEFIANDTASIYPRRDALVRDIFVDIGDKVNSGDTLAILFNPGVQGEGQSNINIKNTIVQSKTKLLQEVSSVKNAKIAELEQKIIERETIMNETIKNFDAQIAEFGDNNLFLSGSQYQIQTNIIDTFKKNLENAELSSEELISEAQNNIIQKEKLLEAKIDEFYNQIIPILYIGEEINIDFNIIKSSDFSQFFGAKDTLSKNKFISDIQKYHNQRQTLSIDEKYTDVIDISDQLVQVLYNTIISVEIPEGLVSSSILKINTGKSSVINQKELLDDAQSNYSVVKTIQKEKIDNIKNQIITKKNELALLGVKNNSLLSEKSLAVSRIKTEIDTLNKSRELLIANENKNIVDIENEIAIAQANLNSESIKSGDYRIISPFSGIISKRGMNIGEMVNPSMEAFRIVDVKTSLSQITKKEIKFFVPQSLESSIEIGKNVSFSVDDNKSTSFTGEIYRISPEIDRDTLSITVQAKVSDDITLPNKSTIRVLLETKQEIFKIPSSTIYNKDERKIIYYKKENGKLGVRDITIVSDDGEYSLITGNIDNNLQIVTTPIFIK